jgi:hypothetical protein
MHVANRKFWDWVYQTFPKYFDEDVVELGSCNVNGSLRASLARDYKSYVGIDIKPGPEVDVVCMAKDYWPPRRVKAVVSASMLEHDATWKRSVFNMVAMLRDDGILAISWGAANNPSHCGRVVGDIAKEGFYPCKAGNVLGWLGRLGMHVHTFAYEATLPYVVPGSQLGSVSKSKPGRGWGEVVLVAFPIDKGRGQVDLILPEDKEDAT